ncbi:MAG: 23S rRNA (adenine(2503)-C(2))-methyltransferase RlmN, partial [Candidatus Omnitrophota bacterium]
MRDIKELSLDELGKKLLSLGSNKYYAKEIFGWIYKKGVLAFDRMSNLPAVLRRSLSEEFYILGLKPVSLEKSKDGVEKFLFELKDKNLVESVSIPASSRITGCISSQAGCKYACNFCAS